MKLREFEGTVYLQGLGEVEGIKAKHLKVGDRRVWNGGDSSEIVRIEPTKTGKSLYVTTKWYNEYARLENGKWIAEWQEDTRRVGAETIVAVTELNPAEEVEKVIEAMEGIEETTEEAPEAPAVATVSTVNATRQHRSFNRWFETFIEEKELDLDYPFIIDHEGFTHVVELGHLKEIILRCSRYEQKAIKEKLVYIDFFNGDVMDFFSHLAKAYIKTNY